MAVEHPQQLDWAHDAFVALNVNDADMTREPQKWASMPASSSSFTIPPSFLTHASVERYGQITPPEELSPADPSRHARESSIPVEQLRNETLWPEHSMQQHQSPPTQLQQQQRADHQERAQKRRRTNRQATGNRAQVGESAPQDQEANPQLSKRKRGRPKSQPQIVEAYTADGFPFQVSSARQSHLEKNRVAAHKCRQRKKEYINGLEGRAREFSSKNKALKANVAVLREEVLSLKNEVLRHAGCNFWAVDEYLARCAGDLLGMEAPLSRTPHSRSLSNSNSPAIAMSKLLTNREPSAESGFSDGSVGSGPEDEDGFAGLDLLKDFDEEMDRQR